MTNNTHTAQLQGDIEALQVKLAYQEDTVEQLNSIVTKQQSQIDELHTSLQAMKEKLKTLQTDDGLPSNEPELPPHY